MMKKLILIFTMIFVAGFSAFSDDARIRTVGGGEVGDWNTVVIMSLDNNDYCEYYKSNNKRRYLFYLLKNGDYNFSTKDPSVYNLYLGFSASLKDMRYAAILE